MLSRLVTFLLPLLLLAGCPEDPVADDDTAGDDDIADDDTGGDPCDPGFVWCQDDWVIECNAQGTGWAQVEDCASQGLHCAAGECDDVTLECATAINEASYIGCEYWATTLANVEIELAAPTNTFTFGLALANGNAADAAVHVSDGPGGQVSRAYTVPAEGMLVIEDLPWVRGTQIPTQDNIQNAGARFYSRTVANAAYHVTSSLPVTAYQFNPLDYQVGAYYSYTNDASLLLPAHVYGDQYLAVARATTKLESMGVQMYRPALLAVVGPDDGPTEVRITSSAHMSASDNGSVDPIAALSPGGTLEVTLEPFEVLQLMTADPNGCPNPTYCMGATCCDVPPEYDPTGTLIEVLSGPDPAVFAGSMMSFVPYDVWAADHLEQQMFPLATWGAHYICARNITQAAGEPTVWRVVSGADGNQIAFVPQSVHAAITLDQGEFVEFESFADFEVAGSDRLAVAQFMVGQNYTSDDNPPQNGDPAMALGVPVEQYRTSYTFLAPDSYAHNYVTVVHAPDNCPLLDGIAVSGETVQITGDWARTNLEITGGIHDIESELPFAITIYGVGNYTSYMYPGGLDLRSIGGSHI